jgi:hypothetical protein
VSPGTKPDEVHELFEPRIDSRRRFLEKGSQIGWAEFANGRGATARPSGHRGLVPLTIAPQTMDRPRVTRPRQTSRPGPRSGHPPRKEGRSRRRGTP